MKSVVFASTLILFSTSLSAQLQEFGIVTLPEMNLSSYEKDTAANAVILFDIGEAILDRTMGTKFTRHVRMKIFKKQALELADIKAYGAKGGITKVKASTFNLENGKIVRHDLPDSLVNKTRYNKYYDEKTFALPNVKEGSIIEYEITFRNASLFLPAWTFQHNIPCMLSEYHLHSPYTDYITRIHGEHQILNHVKKYQDKYQIWTMEHIPAFVREPLMPDPDIYKSSIAFTFKKTWLEIYASLMDSYLFANSVYDKFHSVFSSELKAIKNITDDEIKIRKIVNIVNQNIIWSGYADFYSDSYNDIVKRKRGSVGDINLLLANLLHREGYDVDLVLLSTRDHGFVIKDFESIYQFNYVVCHVKLPNNKELYLDATDKLLPLNVLPKRCHNYTALSVSKKEMAWIKLEPNKKKTFISGNFTLSDQGELTGAINCSKFEYAAFEARKVNREFFNENEIYKAYFDEPAWNIKRTKSQGLEDLDQPLVEDFDITVSDFATQSGDLLHFNPVIFFKQEELPFKSEKRNYPISFELPLEEMLTASIVIPDNYAIEELPKNQIMALPNNDAKYTYNISVVGNRIQIISKFQLNETLFMQDEYPSLKEFYKRIISKQSESIVLKKIK